MNFIFYFLLINIFAFKFIYGDVKSLCEGKNPWICVQNPGSDTWNITQDCLLNNITDRFLMTPWHPGVPGKINTMTIQNCEEVLLYTGLDFTRGEVDFIEAPIKIEFTRLVLINISELYQYPFKDPSLSLGELWEGDPLISVKSYAEKSKFVKELKNCWIKETVFENIQSAYFYHNFLPHCILTDIKFFKLNNVYFNEGFLMSPKETVEIKFSNFKQMQQAFKFADVNQAIISNNYFGQSYTGGIFNIKAKKIILQENEFEILRNNSILFTSKNIQITGNFFHHISDYAFNLITSSSFSDPKTDIRISYNFSNNVIYSLAPSSLSISAEKNGRKTFFDDLIIKNNSISCDCPNIYWFGSIYYKKKDPLENRFYKKWTAEINDNKCSNIVNCSISQVSNNYRTLCEEDYDCSKVVEDKSVSEFKKTEFISTDSLYMNSEISQNISNLLQRVLGQIEKIPGKELVYIDAMHSCLLVITIVFCLVLSFWIVGKCLEFGFVKEFVLKFRPKNLRFKVFETEMENV